jgi:electron transfer flavoprotein beta subunit
MKIVACVKYVPDTTIKVKITADEKGVDLSDVPFIVNPYCEFAVEEALKIKESQGGEVVVVSAGSENLSRDGSRFSGADIRSHL